MNIFESRRREPRIALRTETIITIVSGKGRGSQQVAKTTDVSPHGASVVVRRELLVGTLVRYEAVGYRFRTRARVHSCVREVDGAGFVLGLEHLDGADPLVIWRAPDEADVEKAPASVAPANAREHRFTRMRSG